MPTIRTSLLAGGVALALALCAQVARAQTPSVLIALPGGRAVEILGADAGPQPVVPAPIPGPVNASLPALSASDSPFALLDRVSAEMDRQVEAMLRDVQAWARMPQAPGLPVPAAFGSLPPGASGYAMVSTFSGLGGCTQSVRITFAPGDARPQVVSSHSGDCAAPSAPLVPADQPMTLPAQPSGPTHIPEHAPGTLLVKAHGAHPWRHMLHRAVAWKD